LSSTPEAPGWLTPRARVAEAAVLLLIAVLLIRLAPLRLWRRSLGRMAPAPADLSVTIAHRRIARAVVRATTWLPGDYVCLPRAMAVQWMLRRRGLPSTLVFGVVQGGLASGDIHALHAWVETGSTVLIGADPTRRFARGLTLVQP
jgi:Transglutaminase-like superfamily